MIVLKIIIVIVVWKALESLYINIMAKAHNDKVREDLRKEFDDFTARIIEEEKKRSQE